MKKLLLLLLFILSVIFPSIGQEDLDGKPTTEEEYNYLTKGYKVQIESGLDMKQGYELESFGEIGESNYTFDFKLLFRKESKEVAGILVVAKSSVSGNKYYVCIPKNNPELTKRYYDSIYSWDGSISKSYAKVLSLYLVNIVAAANDMEKKSKK